MKSTVSNSTADAGLTHKNRATMYKQILHFFAKNEIPKDICYTFVACLQIEGNGCFF